VLTTPNTNIRQRIMETKSNSTDPEQPKNALDYMGYEAPVDTPTETIQAPSVQDQINAVLKEVTVDDNGKFIYPDGTDPVMKAAVAASKSYRDTQSGYTKSQQSLKESEAENVLLREKLGTVLSKPQELTPERQQELNDLMFTDPEAWRVEMNKLETESSAAGQAKITEMTEEVRNKAGAEHELERRYGVLSNFNEGRAVEITADALDNDVPPRINSKLASGEITFEAYLEEVSTYLEKGKTVAKPKESKTTDIQKGAGSSTAAPGAADDEGIDYSHLTF